MAAAASGNVNVTLALLNLGADVDMEMDKSLINAAHEAAKGGHIEVIKVSIHLSHPSIILDRLDVDLFTIAHDCLLTHSYGCRTDP